MTSSPASVASGTPLVRRVLRTLAGAWAGGILANLVFAIVDGSRGTRQAVALTLLLLGAIVGWIESRDAGPWRPGDVRDGMLGWGIVAGILIGTVGAAALPMPWGLIAALATFALIGVFAVEMRPPNETAPPTRSP